MTEPKLAFADHFADLPDPRIDRTKKHLLIDILAITLCATIAGADSFEQVERFGRARHDWLRRFLALPNGIPSHDTFNRVLAALDPPASSPSVSPPGWPPSARSPASNTSASTASRPAAPRATPSAAGCTWSAPGRSRTA